LGRARRHQPDLFAGGGTKWGDRRTGLVDSVRRSKSHHGKTQERFVIIYGYRTVVRQLAMIMMVCSRCNVQAPHQLSRRVKKFTLFFIPLFPISIWHLTRCTNCGKSHTIRKATAMQLLAQSQGGQPQPQSQPYPQTQPV
jgi:ribosomal protein L44E